MDYLSRRVYFLEHCLQCGTYATICSSQSLAIDDHYGEKYYGTSKGKFSPFFEFIFRWNQRRNAHAIHKRFQPRRVVDVGCARGYLLSQLKKLNCEVSGLETSSAASWILNNPQVPVKTLDEKQRWPFDSESIDLVIYWHVFEHLDDPVMSLEEATRVLVDAGVLCISIPNSDSLQAKLGLRTWFHLDVPRHLFHFSRSSLCILLARNNYQIVSVQPGDAIQDLYGWFQSLANLITPNNPNLLYRRLQGGPPWQSCPSKLMVLIQIISAFLWVPAGMIGFIVERILRRTGTITVYAKKNRPPNSVLPQ